MKPPPLDYYDPRSIDEAIGLMSSLDDPKILAGGQSLMPMLNMRYVVPKSLVDLNRIPELRYCRCEHGSIVIGALTRQRDLEESALIREQLPLVFEGLSHVGHLATKSRGTIGGSLCHLDPAAELPLVALALDATVEVRSLRGTREITMREFPASYMTPSIAPDEVVTEIRFPIPQPGTTYAFEEFARRHGDFAIVSVATRLTLQSGRVVQAAVAVGGAGTIPRRAKRVEERLLGERPEGTALEDAVRLSAEVDCVSDAHVTANYRRHLVGVLVRRALMRAARGIASKSW